MKRGTPNIQIGINLTQFNYLRPFDQKSATGPSDPLPTQSNRRHNRSAPASRSGPPLVQAHLSRCVKDPEALGGLVAEVFQLVGYL